MALDILVYDSEVIFEHKTCLAATTEPKLISECKRHRKRLPCHQMPSIPVELLA